MVRLNEKYHKFANPKQQNDADVILGTRACPETKSEFENFAKQSGWTKKQTMDFLLRYAMESISPEEARRLKPGDEIIPPKYL